MFLMLDSDLKKNKTNKPSLFHRMLHLFFVHCRTEKAFESTTSLELRAAAVKMGRLSLCVCVHVYRVRPKVI